MQWPDYRNQRLFDASAVARLFATRPSKHFVVERGGQRLTRFGVEPNRINRRLVSAQSALELDHDRLFRAVAHLIVKVWTAESTREHRVVFLSTPWIHEGLKCLIDPRHHVVASRIGIDVWVVLAGKPTVCAPEGGTVCAALHPKGVVQRGQGLNYDLRSGAFCNSQKDVPTCI